MPRSLHTFSAAQRVRLWLSYQRYAVLLVLAGTGIAALALALTPWWLWPVAAIVVFKLLHFAGYILWRHRDKMRATAIGMIRIAQGRFAPESVQGYCGDPCFRVVAGELLAKAGYHRRERAALIRDYARLEDQRASATVIFDRRKNRVLTVGVDGTVPSPPSGA